MLAQSIKCVLMTASFASLSPLIADDSSTAWRKILSKCAKSELIGKQLLFFGVSNTIGPGSVWRFEEDRSLRLLFELGDAFPNSTEQERILVTNNTATCSGISSSSWNIKFGLPFSTGLTPVSIDISAELGKAKKVSVSVTGFAIANVKETAWKEAVKSLAPENPYRQELSLPDRMLAANTVKVTGLKTTLTFGSKLAADVKAKYSGTTFKLGENGATLHAAATGDNEITLTAEGPFYMLAAYSKLIGGAPLGVGPADRIPSLAPASSIPSGTIVKREVKR